MKTIFTLLLLFVINNLLFSQQFRSVVFNPPTGSDSQFEYLEISGPPNTSLTGKCFVVIEGDSPNQGTIDQKIDLSSYSFGSNGLLLIRATTQLPASGATSVVNINFSPDLENGTNTYLIMDCPTQNVGDDLDTDNDGVLDGTPFAGLTINDAVSVTDGGGSDHMYGASLGGTNIPVKPGTTSTEPDAFFRQGGIIYGAQLQAAPPGTSTPSDNQIAIFAAWSSAGVDAPGLANQILSNGNTPSPFPVNLTSFKAVALGQEVHLDWATTDESNFSHFSVERSFDAKSFEAIGRVEAKATKTTDETVYQFVDQTPNFGTNYYRLRQVDIDGSYEYSRIISANMTETSPVVIYPNPSADFIRIKNGEKEAIKSYEIYTPSGKLVRHSQDSINEINIQDLPSGIYFLQLTNDRNSLINRRFIKI